MEKLNELEEQSMKQFGIAQFSTSKEEKLRQIQKNVSLQVGIEITNQNSSIIYRRGKKKPILNQAAFEFASLYLNIQT